MVKNLNDREFLENHFIFFCTREGVIKKTPLEAFSRPRANGILAMSFREGDQLIEVRLTNGNNHVLLASRQGKAIHFHESDVRSMGRTAAGVRGMNLEDDVEDAIVGMVCVEPDSPMTILALSEKGVGKRTELEEYRVQTRGGKGIKTISVTPRTGKLVAIKTLTDEEDLIIINRSGLTIRISARELPISGRATQGVKLINLKGDDAIADVSVVKESEEEDLPEGEETPEIVSE